MSFRPARAQKGREATWAVYLPPRHATPLRGERGPRLPLRQLKPRGLATAPHTTKRAPPTGSEQLVCVPRAARACDEGGEGGALVQAEGDE